MVDRRKVRLEQGSSAEPKKSVSEFVLAIVDAAIGAIAVLASDIQTRTGARNAGREIRTDAAVRSVLWGGDFRSNVWNDAIAVAANPQSAWRSSAIQWLVGVARGNSSVVMDVYNGLALDSPGSIGRSKTEVLLRLVRPCAGSFPIHLAKLLLKRLFFLSDIPIDPYSDGSLTLLSRQAVVALLEERADLYDVAIEFVKIAPKKANQKLRLELISIASRARSSGNPDLLLRLAKAASLKGSELDEVALLFDSVIERDRPSTPVALGLRRVNTVGGWLGRRLLAPLGTLMSAAAPAVWAWTHEWSGPVVKPALAEGVAALAAVVTANVFTVQLSTNRLPGFMARAAGHPWQLTAAYASSLLMLCLPFIKIDDARAMSALGWSSLAAATIFGSALTLAVLKWSGRTDASEAARLFAVLKQASFAAAGRRFGRLQARASELKDCIESIPVASTAIDSVIGERSEELRQRRRGVFVLSKRRLRRLLQRTEFLVGMRIRVASGIGTVKEPGDRVINLVPGKSQTVRKSLVRAGRRVIKVEDATDMEFVSSVLVAMSALAISLAEGADSSSAQKVNRSSILLMQMHISAVRRARYRAIERQSWFAEALERHYGLIDGVTSSAANSRARDDDPAPVIPAARATAALFVSKIGALNTAANEIALSFCDALLDASGNAEAVGAIIFHTLPGEGRNPSVKHLELGWRVGLHSLERANRLLWSNVLDWCAQLRSDPNVGDHALDVMAHLVAASCRFAPRFSNIGLEKFASATKDREDAASAVFGLWHIGAAALAAGSFSTAISAARVVQSRNKGTVLAQLSTPATLSSSKLRADLRGGYLGDLGADALAVFAKFPSDFAEFL